jgi:hypothetical protein
MMAMTKATPKALRLAATKASGEILGVDIGRKAVFGVVGERMWLSAWSTSGTLQFDRLFAAAAFKIRSFLPAQINATARTNLECGQRKSRCGSHSSNAVCDNRRRRYVTHALRRWQNF